MVCWNISRIYHYIIFYFLQWDNKKSLMRKRVTMVTKIPWFLPFWAYILTCSRLFYWNKIIWLYKCFKYISIVTSYIYSMDMLSDFAKCGCHGNRNDKNQRFSTSLLIFWEKRHWKLSSKITVTSCIICKCLLINIEAIWCCDGNGHVFYFRFVYVFLQFWEKNSKKDI